MKIFVRISLILSVLLTGLNCVEAETILLDSTRESSLLGVVQGVFSTDPAGQEQYNVVVKPSPYNPSDLGVWARHLGANFYEHKDVVTSSEMAQIFSEPFRLLGSAATERKTSLVPSFVAKNDSSYGIYMDTRQLYQDSQIPFPPKYCKKVGLGAPHVIHSKEYSTEQNIRPWQKEKSALVMSIEAKLPVAEMKARNPEGKYLTRNFIESTDNSPVFISTLFVYLKDTVNNNTIAILFSFYDPRGASQGSVMNDHHNYFYTTYWPAEGATPSTDEYTVESGRTQRYPFSDYKKFQISMNAAQLKNIIAKFPSREKLSANPADYMIVISGLINEMNYLYSDPSQCLPNYDAQTYAVHAIAYKNLKFSIR